MAVTPIRRQMSAVPQQAPAMRAPVPMPTPHASAQQMGWMWDGSSWQWCDPDWDCGPPSSGCCPPQTPGCWCWVPSPPVTPSPLPPPPLTGPIIGVTDGSDAAPGQVGEFVPFSQVVNFNSGTANYSVSVGVLQPGDWDCWAAVEFYTVPVTFTVAYLNPQPVGFAGVMSGVTESLTMAVFATTICMPTRASLVVPTLIPFTVQINAPTAGNCTLTFSARRRR